MKYINNYVNQKRQFEIDDEADVANLPTHAGNNVGYHSKAVVQKTGNVYTLLETDEWVLFGGES